jgi:fructose-specific phosphotransferase system component IIB
MKKSHVSLMALLCLLLNNITKAQDITVDTISISTNNGKYTVNIAVKNNDKLPINQPVRIYVELHGSQAVSNPISQLQLQTAALQPMATQTFHVNINQFQFVRGFNAAHVSKLIVLCDPKNELKEKDETNNTKTMQSIRLVNIK